MGYEFGAANLYSEAAESWRLWCRRKGLLYALPSRQHSRVSVDPETGDGVVVLANTSGRLATFSYKRKTRQMTKEAS